MGCEYKAAARRSRRSACMLVTFVGGSSAGGAGGAEGGKLEADFEVELPCDSALTIVQIAT